MPNDFKYTTNQASLEQIIHHLKECDLSFRVPLSERLFIADYGEKLFNFSVRFEVWDEEELSGLIAAYCNDRATNVAYISHVGISNRYRNKGLGASLLKYSIESIKSLAFKTIKLEVDAQNTIALKIYAQAGFTVDKTNDENKDNISLTLELING